jgi:HD domain-containing protein
MLLRADHLVPGMRLGRDIELKAGSYLITRRDLADRKLTPRVIESIRNFSHQVIPTPGMVVVDSDEFVLRYVRGVLSEDLHRISDQVLEGKLYPNFLADGQIQVKVMRVMEMLFTNPDIARMMYESKYSSAAPSSPSEMIIEHSIRVTLLSLALGLKMGWTIIGLMSLGTAALLHDTGLLDPRLSMRMQGLDDCSDQDVSDFVALHQARTVEMIQEQDLSVGSYHRQEIIKIVAGHHDASHDETSSRGALLLYFTDLLDEMVCRLPHGLRYNFSAEEIALLGGRFRKRVGLVELLTALNRLYGRQAGVRMEIISNLADLFNMREVLVEDFSAKLQEMIDWCPYDSAAANPVGNGNFLPRTIYCSRSNEDGFKCQHMVYVNVNVVDQQGKAREYLKCGELDSRLKNLSSKS